MKLYKALKLKKKIIGEIAKLKEQIAFKNSYLDGSLNAETFNASEAYETLEKKIETLVNLKIAINEGNKEIQALIYSLSEYKSLLSFWNNLNTTEGITPNRFSSDHNTIVYKTHFNEKKAEEMIVFHQNKIDVIQDEIDVYNHNTEIPWENK
jgi:hypothetical protein